MLTSGTERGRTSGFRALEVKGFWIQALEFRAYGFRV